MHEYSLSKAIISFGVQQLWF